MVSLSYQNIEHDVEEDLHISHPAPSQNSKSSYVSYLKVIGIATVALAVMLMTASNISGKSNILSSKLVEYGFTLSSETSYTISILASSPDYEQMSSLSMLPWDAIVEPYRSQTLSISSFEIDGESVTVSDDDFIVTWTIDGTEYTGSQVSVTISKTGALSASVSVVPLSSSKYSGPKLMSGKSRTTDKRKLHLDYDASKYPSTTSSSYDLSFTIASKYVRREIRDLTDSDRTTVLDAMKMLYTLSDSEGQATYGEKYHSAQYFAAKHLLGGGTTDCDHFHDGAGMAVTHVALTLEYEQSLQSINPAIALPYWEYSMDNYKHSVLSESEIYSSDWFGEMNPPGDHSVDTSHSSRFGDVTVPSGDAYKEWDISTTGSLNPYVNAYNQLRSAWNNNPSAHIGRNNLTYGTAAFTSYPSCEILYEAYSQVDLTSLNAYLNDQTHGPTHILIGGTWLTEGDNTLLLTPGSKSGFKYLTGVNKLLMFKVLWRMGYTRCPTSCSEGDVCRCSVPSEYRTSIGAKQILANSKILYSLVKFGFITDVDSQTDSFYEDFLTAVEHPGVAGEMFSSNAAWDPLFWVVHGTMERLLAVRRVLSSQGDYKFGEDWGYPSYNENNDLYLSGRCDWSGVSSAADTTLPTCSTSSSCYGHSESDTMSFTNFLGNGETYTNADFYTFMHPWNDDLTYVYDSYTYDYCSTYAGIDFVGSEMRKFKGYSKEYLATKNKK